MKPTLLLAVAAMVMLTTRLEAQPPGKWPPDSLINTQVIPRTTPVIQVIGTMRNFAANLGVRCHFCHLGVEGQPLEQFDFASDEKRTKVVARQMIRMVRQINAQLDSLPGRGANGLQVTCGTCHRGVSRPVPLSTLIAEVGQTAGADSAIRAYRSLRERYYGADAYDFGESSLNIAAFRLGRAKQVVDGLAILDHNEGLFPGSSGLAVFRGNLLLMKGDTAAAANSFREAVRRDPRNDEARGRLKDVGATP